MQLQCKLRKIVNVHFTIQNMLACAGEDPFGPWSDAPQKNRWDEVRIGKLEQWYEMVSRWFKGSTPVIPEASPSPGLETRASVSRQTRTQASSPVKASGIPTSVKKRQKPPANATISSVQTIESPRGPVVERTVPEAVQRAFVSVKYEPRDSWADPRSFDAFLSNPQYMLQPWPTASMTLDESIGRVAQFLSPRNTQSERAPRSPKRAGAKK